MTIEFICRDTGIGMTKDFQKRLFEPFAQEHTGSRTKFSGTGLGMPITKKLIEKWEERSRLKVRRRRHNLCDQDSI